MEVKDNKNEQLDAVTHLPYFRVNLLCDVPSFSWR